MSRTKLLEHSGSLLGTPEEEGETQRSPDVDSTGSIGVIVDNLGIFFFFS